MGRAVNTDRTFVEDGVNERLGYTVRKGRAHPSGTLPGVCDRWKEDLRLRGAILRMGRSCRLRYVGGLVEGLRILLGPDGVGRHDVRFPFFVLREGTLPVDQQVDFVPEDSEGVLG